MGNTGMGTGQPKSTRGLPVHLPNFAYLVRSGSVVAVKRVFSGGGDTISLRRASLKPSTIQRLMLIKHKLLLARLQYVRNLEKKAKEAFIFF